MTVDDLLGELYRIRECNSKELIYYNSDEAMVIMGTRQRVAAIKAVCADSRWLDGLVYSIKEAVDFVQRNPEK